MGTPNWAEIATAVAAGLTAAFLLWDRLRTKVPELVVTIEPARSANHPEFHYLVVQPILWGTVMIEAAEISNGRISLPAYEDDGCGGRVPTGGEAWAAEVRLNRRVSARDQRPTSVLLALEVGRSAWPWRRSNVVTVTSLVTSPIRRRVRNKIDINMPS